MYLLVENRPFAVEVVMYMIKRSHLLAILSGLALGASLFSLSCSGDPNACSPGKPCICSGSGQCERYCTGNGCEFECDGQVNCKFSCDQGGCKVKAAGQGTVVFFCKGGNCRLDYSGSGKADLSCEGNNCKMTCTGQSCQLVDCTKNCSLTCSIQSSICKNECEDNTCSLNRN